MEHFAQEAEHKISFYYSKLSSSNNLNHIFIYLSLFFILFALNQSKKTAVITHVIKTLDPGQQVTLKTKLKEQTADIKTQVDSLKASLASRQTSNYSIKINEAYIELGKIQNLHNEFKMEIIDSHQKIIESLLGSTGKEGQEKNEKGETRDVREAREVRDARDARDARGEREARDARDNEKGKPARDEVRNKDPKMKDEAAKSEEKFENPSLAKGATEVYGSNDALDVQDKTRKNSENTDKPDKRPAQSPFISNTPPHEAQAEVPKDQAKADPPKPKIFNPRPAPVNIPRNPVPVRGKVPTNPTSERPKYAAPSTIKSSPFG